MFKHALMWFVITTLSIVLLPGLVNPATYLNKVKEDQKQLAHDIGAKSANSIITTADSIYNKLFEDSGFHPWVNQRYQIGQHRQSDLFEPDNFDKAGRFAETYVVTFFISMYEAIFRLTQLFYWAAFALPFIAAAIFDGMMQRKVRIATFYYSSPAKYNALWHFIIALFSITVIYCNTPLSMPAAVFPMLVFIATMSIRSMLANLQRSA